MGGGGAAGQGQGQQLSMGGCSQPVQPHAFAIPPTQLGGMQLMQGLGGQPTTHPQLGSMQLMQGPGGQFVMGHAGQGSGSTGQPVMGHAGLPGSSMGLAPSDPTGWTLRLNNTY